MEIFTFEPERLSAGRKRAASGRGASAERALDVTVALLALFFFLPLILLVALVIKLDTRGPLLFRHMRIGRGGEVFACLKFRTMVVNGDELLTEKLATCEYARMEWQSDFKLRNDPRVTRLGRFLRKASIDELPQLINVLRGEMSIVGPRPIVEEEIDRYGDYFEDYCSVRPGLTGLWQISGRNDVSYEERVRLDTRYARTKSLKSDVAIIAKTVPAVLRVRGSY